MIGATCVVPAAVPSDLKRAALPALALEAGWAMKKRVLPMVPSQTGSEPIGDPAGRVREIQEHHRIRLDETAAALGEEPGTAYEVSLALFGDDLDAFGRRFALAETLAHLERLIREGRAARAGDDNNVSYTAA